MSARRDASEGLTPDEVRRIADLAALELSDDEAGRLAGELSGILGHFRALRDMEDTEDTEGHGDTEGAPLRPDVPGADPLAEGPEAQAPEWADGFFTVPGPGFHGGDADYADTADSADGEPEGHG